MDVDTSEWFDAISCHYHPSMPTPVDAAYELLRGCGDPDAMAQAINRRGLEVGDDVMAATTAADCSDAVDELIELGFLESVFVASSSLPGLHCEEHVLELRIPRGL